MTPSRNLRAGVFLPPLHPTDDDPTLWVGRAFELVEGLEKLGFARNASVERMRDNREDFGAPNRAAE